MSISVEPEAGLDDSERVIDRSGDIDQRPLEERTGKGTGNVIALPAYSPNERLPSVKRYDAPSLPAARLQPPQPGLAELAQRLQKDMDKHHARAKSQLESLSQKIEGQEKRCGTPKLDGDLQQIRFQRQKVLIANGPVLAGCLREERSRLSDLETFKTANRLLRDAHYPSSPMLAFGVLSILILIEAGINGVLFAESSDQGLFGGWLEAFVLSITNVGAAFLFGRLALPQLHRRSFLAKAAAGVLCVAWLGGLFAVNLIGAHYRDFKREATSFDLPGSIALKDEARGTVSVAKRDLAGPLSRKAVSPVSTQHPQPPQRQVSQREDGKEREAIKKVLEAPFAFDSFMSFFLFVIGLCGAAIAALDGYKLDDPFPGYGRRHRRYAEAREQSAQALRSILNQSNAIMTGSFQAIGRKLENFAHEMSALLTLHHAYAAEYKTLRDSLEEAASDAEAQIACHERLVNKVPSHGSGDLYAVAVKQLPQLSEKQIKFYETQDKKLKALQKSAQKEQSDVLGVFEAASSDFQKLLADASQAQLQAALGSQAQGKGG